MMLGSADILRIQLVGVVSANPERHFIDFKVDSSLGGHAGSSIINLSSGASGFEIQVRSISLNKQINNLLKTNRKVLVKLDVEGVEIACIKSLDKNNYKNIIILYEDHGSDLQSSTTKWLLDSGKFTIHYLTKEGSISIFEIEQLKKLKRNKRVGYNLVAPLFRRL